MTDEEKALRITTVNKLNIDESMKRLEQLKSIELTGLTEIQKIEYLILKFKVEGKDSFFGDSYITNLLQQLILIWIEEKREIPVFFANLFFMCHVDWLIDWNNSIGTNVVVRQDIIDNMHTFISPFLEEIEEILGEAYKTRSRFDLKDRIINDIEGLANYDRKEKLPLIYNALFKVKYALQAAREYMESNNKKSINIESNNYELDIQSIAHIFLRHTNRFKTLSHRDNSGKRGFMNNELGNEYEELNDLLSEIESNASIMSDGVYTCRIGTDNYKIVLKDDRIVTLYPLLTVV
jgi:hypothetical protein